MWIRPQGSDRERAKDEGEGAVLGQVMKSLKNMPFSCGNGALLLKGFMEGNGGQEWRMDLKRTRLVAEKLFKRPLQ